MCRLMEQVRDLTSRLSDSRLVITELEAQAVGHGQHVRELTDSMRTLSGALLVAKRQLSKGNDAVEARHAAEVTALREAHSAALRELREAMRQASIVTP